MICKKLHIFNLVKSNIFKKHLFHTKYSSNLFLLRFIYRPCIPLFVKDSVEYRKALEERGERDQQRTTNRDSNSRAVSAVALYHCVPVAQW